MWSYNYDYLCHGKFKYVDKYLSKAKNWVYVYSDKAKKAVTNTASKAKNAITKTASGIANKLDTAYTTSVKNNMYATDPYNYKAKRAEIQKTQEWKDIVKRKDPEYVSVDSEGKITYKIDDYILKKKHPLLDVIDDVMNGRPVTTNKVDLETLVAAADDYVQAGAAYIGVRAKVLSEAMKYRSGAYVDEEQEIMNTIDKGSKLVQDLVKTYEENPKAANDLINQYSDMAARSQNIQKIANYISKASYTSDLSTDELLSNENVQQLMSQYGITEADVKKYL